MGSGCSSPLPDLPSNNFMAISLHAWDSFIVLYGGQPELDVIRHSIVQFWSKGIQEEKPKFASPENPNAATRCYKFKMNGYPFSLGDKSSSIESRKMCANVLYGMYNLGWKLLVSSDLSQMQDLTTWFFQRQTLIPNTQIFFSIGISSFDKLQISNCPVHLHSVIKDVCLSCWTNGLREKNISDSTFEIKFEGNPWHYVNKAESIMARHMLKQIIQSLSARQWLLYGNSNLKSTADTLFFRHDPTLQGEIEFLSVSLNRTDRLRFIHMPDGIVAGLEEVVRQIWYNGIQDIKDERPVCYELKLKGNPWWASGNEAITSRLLIVKLMEKLSSYGYFVITGLDITRKTNDKSLLLFQRGAPLHTKFMCLSLNETDKIRLINAPNDVNSVGREIISKWVLGVQEEKNVYGGVTYQAKLIGNPWSTISGDGIHGRALLLGLLNAFTSMGWRLVCSADVSAKYIHQDKGPDYPLDVHSWYFMFDESMQQQQPAPYGYQIPNEPYPITSPMPHPFGPNAPTANPSAPLYPTLPETVDPAPPSYYDAIKS
ncbi:uncharacterized protein LOC130612077 [Hydractinia symbiolongicarpus]|uniref:uncharacterized protein LOC130612077 n=1 Tax=Hydractinia symbiolongicarpus TaxID=13093 RepID=UPI00254E3AB2|nr:uncharacterized protein LOC130612077 [Hydractinia symbiolongicarpus]